MTKVYLALGGNEGNVLNCLEEAISLLSVKKGVDHLQVSNFYQTAPFEVESSQWFVNAVCSFMSPLSPLEIFKMTQEIEKQLGKIEKSKTAARPIDIDFIFYGNQAMYDQVQGLEIPHPRWKERLFVLIPLADLTSEIEIAGGVGMERYYLKDLIQPLLIQSPNAVSFLKEWSTSSH